MRRDFIKSPGFCRLLLALILLGMLARVALAATTWGSRDASTWMRFGQSVWQHGYLHTLRHDDEFNHPPFPAYLASWCWAAASASGIAFPHLFKLVMVGADALTALLIYRSAQTSNTCAALPCAALFSWNLSSIYVTGYHCNTDPIYAGLALLAAILFAQRRYALAGIALGAAINIKLIPTLLILPFLLLCRTRNTLLKFSAGLSLMATPFLALLLLEPDAFTRHVMQYGSFRQYWGINAILLELQRVLTLSAYVEVIIPGYAWAGRFILYLAAILTGLSARRRGGLGAIEAATMTSLLFLILTPGFGAQYVVFVIPLMAVRQPVWGFLFGTVMGVGLFCSALVEVDGFVELISPRRQPLRIAAWILLIGAAISLWRKRQTVVTVGSIERSIHGVELR